MRPRCSEKRSDCSLRGGSTKPRKSTRTYFRRTAEAEEALINLVTIGIARKDIQTIREYSERLIQLRPNSQTALEGLATCAFADEDFEAASRYCQKLVEATPDHFERWFNLGVANQKLGNKEDAANAYSEAIRIRPDGKQAHVNLGMVRQELGDLKSARESYERALQISPDIPEVFYNLASILEQQGAKEEAEKYYAKLTAQRGDSSEDAWFRLGYLRLQKGDFRGSIEAFQACVRKRADWPEAHVNLGIAHWRLGDREQAVKAFEQVITLDAQLARRASRSGCTGGGTRRIRPRSGPASEADQPRREDARAVLQHGSALAENRTNRRRYPSVPRGDRTAA